MGLQPSCVRMRDPNDIVGLAMAKALSIKAQAREERPAREGHTPQRWQPPRCSMCKRRPADIEKLDYEPGRPYFCKSNECFQLYRDNLHGSRGRLPEAPISAEEVEIHGS